MEYTVELEKEEIKGNKEIAYILLKSKVPYFVDTDVKVEESTVSITSVIKESYTDFDYVKTLILEEKLRYLINLSEVYTGVENTNYTYNFDTNSVVFTRDGLPLLVHRGIVNQVYPYEKITYDKFLQIYKAMSVALLDDKADYEKLVNGSLEFYKGNLLGEYIANLNTLDEVVEKFSEEYKEEKAKNLESYSRITKKRMNFLKFGFISTAALAVILGGTVGYMSFVTVGNKNKLLDIRLSFINKDYSNVIKTSEKVDSKSLSQDDKYIVAYSVIQSEPLSAKQKEQLLKINNQSNSDYLRYWVLIGQAKIDEAIDVASFLDDPQLLMYGLTKKIDEVQRDPNLSSEKRTEQLNNYKTKLEELKKKYVPTDENAEKKSDKK